MKYLLLALISFQALAQETTPELFDYCEELPYNTAVKVIIPAGRSRTTTQKYTLVRAGEKVFDVYLNLEFKAKKSYDGNIKGKKEINDYFKKNMDACFDSHNHRLKDELGRQIRLHVYDAETDKLPSAPPKVKISLSGEDHRSNSFNYESDIDCPTMIHEAFHLLGLIDEYEEKWLGFNHSFFSLAFKPFVPTSDKVKPAFDCRAIGPDQSIMHNQWTMYWGRPLFSGQVNTIIYPNCEEKNKKYYTCAKYAYSTSKENNGALPNLFGDCAKKVPDYCKTPDWVKIDP